MGPPVGFGARLRITTLRAASGPGVELLEYLKEAIDVLGCAPCRAYLSTYRKPRELTGKAGRVPMPEEMKQRLHRLLLDRLSRSEES